MQKSAQHKKTKLRSAGVLKQIADYTQTDCRLVKNRLDNNKLAKDGLRAKSCNKVWLKIDCEQSLVMIFV